MPQGLLKQVTVLEGVANPLFRLGEAIHQLHDVRPSTQGLTSVSPVREDRTSGCSGCRGREANRPREDSRVRSESSTVRARRPAICRLAGVQSAKKPPLMSHAVDNPDNRGRRTAGRKAGNLLLSSILRRAVSPGKQPESGVAMHYPRKVSKIKKQRKMKKMRIATMKRALLMHKL